MYEMGDVVKVWSLQSFHGGGFLKGATAIVMQDQHGEDGSVLVTVERNFNGERMLDKSYEVYVQQTQLVSNTNKSRKENMRWFKSLLEKIRTHEHQMEMDGKRKAYREYCQAPEFFIGGDNLLVLDRTMLEYPELFI